MIVASLLQTHAEWLERNQAKGGKKDLFFLFLKGERRRKRGGLSLTELFLLLTCVESEGGRHIVSGIEWEEEGKRKGEGGGDLSTAGEAKEEEEGEEREEERY